MMSEKKVLYINNSPQPGSGNKSKVGGGGQSLLGLWKALPSVAWSGEIVCPAEGPFTSLAIARGANCTIYPYSQPDMKHPVRTISNYYSWRRIISRIKPDIIHANACDAARSAMLASTRLGIPMVCHVRFPLASEAIPWIFRALPKPDAFIFNSKSMLDQHWELLSRYCPRSHGYFVHNPVDLNEFRQNPWPERESYRIGIIGNLTPMKAHDDFIRFAARFSKEVPQAEFWIVGEDTLGLGVRHNLESLARELEVENKIKFLGHRDNIPQILAELHLTVLTSHIEPFGRVLVESMASGRPVVATNVGGIPEVVKDKITGYLVNPGDIEAMTQKSLRILQDRKLWESMSRAGVEDAHLRFGELQHVTSVVDIYNKTISQ